jgi:uncharacterized oligopeptide transporter (OPT) family protein
VIARVVGHDTVAASTLTAVGIGAIPNIVAARQKAPLGLPASMTLPASMPAAIMTVVAARVLRVNGSGAARSVDGHARAPIRDPRP